MSKIYYLFKLSLKILIVLHYTTMTLSSSDLLHHQPEHGKERISAPKPGWIDPFDMLGTTTPSPDTVIVQSDVEIHMLKERCGNYEIYLRRFINMFLRAIELSDDDPNSIQTINYVNMEFYIDKNDVNILQRFGQGGNNAPKIEQVSDIYDRIFSQKMSQERSAYSIDQLVSWLQRSVLKLLSSPEWTVFSSVSLMLFMSLWFIYKTHSYRLALFTILLTIFLTGFGFTWIRMYEEKESEVYTNMKIHGQVPKHCSGEPMVWYEHMFYRMFGVDCYEYYKGINVRAIVKVSPTDVLAETFSSMFVAPTKNLGAAYGEFVSNCLGHLPYWLKPFALPIAFIIPLVFLIILMVFVFNYHLSLSLITGLHLKPAAEQNPQVSTRVDDRYIEDCSSKKNESYISSMLSDSKTPIYLMNWMGLQKLSSNSLLEKNKKEEEHGQDEEVNSLKEDKIEELKEFTKFMASVEDQKEIEDRKQRSIHTCKEGESSLVNRKSDLPTMAMKNIDSSCDSTSLDTSSGKEKTS